MATATTYLNYVQFAMGSISKADLALELDLDNTKDLAGYCYEAARACRTARKYFLEETKGLKQLVKAPGILEMGLECGGVVIASHKAKALLEVCKATKQLITAGELSTKLNGIFEPLQGCSIWEQDADASLAQIVMAKGAKIADWTMSGCDTYRWIAKIGFVAARAMWIDAAFNLASAAFIVNGLYTEGAKWYTGKIIDSMTYNEKKFKFNDQVLSAMYITISVAYAILTAVAVAQMAGYVVAYAASVNFACLATAWTCTIGAHFWKELKMKS